MLKRKPVLKLVPKVDKEFAALIAPLTAEERQQLETNLIAHGCRDALVVWRGLLIDGHNRLEICNRHGLPYDTAEIELPDRESAKLWIEENQIGRRNLSNDQRVAVAYRIMQRRVVVSNKQRTAKARASRGSGISVVVHAGHNSTPRQRERTARELQISTRKLRDITALAKTAPEIVNRIANGEISLRDAKEAVQDQVRQQKVTAVLKKHVSGQGIYTGDMRRLFKLLDDDSVSLFITDAPSEAEALPLYTELGKLAQQKLKPNGFCLVVCGQLHLDEIVKGLSESLDWYWLCAAKFDGPHARIWPRKVTSAFKPILIFTKRPAPKEAVNQWIADLVDQSNAGKGYQDGQAVGDPQYFIEQLTIPGELVVDPFAGYSTVPQICAKIGRPFIGTESDPGLAATARATVASTSKTINRSIENGIVREISIAEAKPVVLENEWLGTMPAVVHHCFGIYFDGAIGGVAVYGVEYTENRGVWRPYGYEGKIICSGKRGLFAVGTEAFGIEADSDLDADAAGKVQGHHGHGGQHCK